MENELFNFAIQALKLGLIGFCFLMSWMCYKLVENPDIEAKKVYAYFLFTLLLVLALVFTEIYKPKTLVKFEIEEPVIDEGCPSAIHATTEQMREAPNDCYWIHFDILDGGVELALNGKEIISLDEKDITIQDRTINLSPLLIPSATNEVMIKSIPRTPRYSYKLKRGNDLMKKGGQED